VEFAHPTTVTYDFAERNDDVRRRLDLVASDHFGEDAHFDDAYIVDVPEEHIVEVAIVVQPPLRRGRVFLVLLPVLPVLQRQTVVFWKI
jgi:hypothetical protein